MKNIALVIVTYNRKKLLVEALTSIINQMYRVKKVIIVDNNSNDGTDEQLQKEGFFNYEEIEYIKLSENIGGAGGFYKGIECALKYDVGWIGLSDDDAIYDINYLKIMSESIEKYKNIKAFSGTVMCEGKIDTTHRRIIKNHLTLAQEGISADNYKNDYFFLDTFSFVGCLISVDIIKKIGLPEKGYFIWFDDTEYSLRIRKETKIMNINNAIIDHRTKLNLNNLVYIPNWKDFYGIRNEYFMIYKHSNFKIIGYLFILFKSLKMFLGSVLKKKYKNYRMYRIKLILDATKEFILKKVGKNCKYLPI